MPRATRPSCACCSVTPAAPRSSEPHGPPQPPSTVPMAPRHPFTLQLVTASIPCPAPAVPSARVPTAPRGERAGAWLRWGGWSPSLAGGGGVLHWLDSGKDGGRVCPERGRSPRSTGGSEQGDNPSR